MKILRNVSRILDFKGRCYQFQLLITIVCIILALLLANVSLYFASSHSKLIFGIDFPFFNSNRVESFQSVSAYEPLVLGGDITITIEELSRYAGYIQVTTRIDNSSDRTQQFSSSQFEMSRLSNSAPYTQDFISTLFSWKYSIKSDSSFSFSHYYPTSVENATFSLNILDDKKTIIGQFLLMPSDIHEF